MSGLILRAGGASTAHSSSNTNTKKDLDSVATDLYKAATQNPKSAEKTFQDTFSALNPERQQQLAETFVGSLGGSGFDAITETVEGQRAMLCVFDNADCKTQNLMKALHKSQVDFSGNTAVDYTRSDGDWKQTMCLDPTICTQDHRSIPDSDVNSKTSDYSASSTNSPTGGREEMKNKAEQMSEETKDFAHLGGVTVSMPGEDSYTIGTPCKDKEISLGVKTKKLLKDKDELPQPEVKLETVCIDPNKAVKFGAAEIVKEVLKAPITETIQKRRDLP
jgi:hypothetical protein